MIHSLKAINSLDRLFYHTAVQLDSNQTIDSTFFKTKHTTRFEIKEKSCKPSR